MITDEMIQCLAVQSCMIIAESPLMARIAEATCAVMRSFSVAQTGAR